MKISIVIPTFKRRDVVLQTISTLTRQTLSREEYEIIVVVDGSTDDTATSLRSLKTDHQLRVIEQENRGVSAARNTGCWAAQSDTLLFLDDDMLCDPGLVAAHVAAHEDGGRLIAFGALFLSADSPRTIAAECFNREIGAFHLAHSRDSRSVWTKTDCVFSNSSMSRSLIRQIGGFNEGFRMREDQEFGTRLFRAGVQPLYVKDAIAYQHYFKSSSDLVKDSEAFAAADLMIARIHPDSAVAERLKQLATEPWLKKQMRRLMVRCPCLIDLCLAPFCALGNALFDLRPVRDLGVRALQARRSVHWLYKLLELDSGVLD